MAILGMIETQHDTLVFESFIKRQRELVYPRDRWSRELFVPINSDACNLKMGPEAAPLEIEGAAGASQTAIAPVAVRPGCKQRHSNHLRSRQSTIRQVKTSLQEAKNRYSPPGLEGVFFNGVA